MFIASIVIYRVGLTRKNSSQNIDPVAKPTESIDGFRFHRRFRKNIAVNNDAINDDTAIFCANLRISAIGSMTCAIPSITARIDTCRFYRSLSILIGNSFATWRNRTLDLRVATYPPYLLDHRARVCEARQMFRVPKHSCTIALILTEKLENNEKQSNTRIKWRLLSKRMHR